MEIGTKNNAMIEYQVVTVKCEVLFEKHFIFKTKK